MAIKKKQRRDYGKDDQGMRRPGVTTVIGSNLGWSKDGLLHWAARESAKATAACILEGAAIEDAIERGRRAHLQARDTAMEAGTLAHSYVEAYLRGGATVGGDVYDDETEVQQRARVAYDRVVAWWPTSGYDVIEAELALIDPVAQYGGTVDLVLRRRSDGATIVGDLKTGKSVYDEVAIQLGAYAVLLGQAGHDVAGGLVVHAPIDGPLSTIEVDKATLAVGAAAFTSLLHLHRSRTSLKLKVGAT